MKNADRVIVVGASGFGRECLDVLQAMQRDRSSIEILGVIDDAPTAVNLGRLKDREVSYLGTIEEWMADKHTDVQYVLGIGNPNIRKRLVRRFEEQGYSPFSAIHPSATIGSELRRSPGVVICAGAAISTNVQIGNHVHINPNVTIGHDSIIGDFTSVNPAAVISGEVRIENGVLIGAAALVLQNLIVGERSTIGASALVTKNVPVDVVVKGVPGRWDGDEG